MTRADNSSYLAQANARRHQAALLAAHHATSADFRTGTSALGSGEFEVELASVPPGDGGVGGQVGFAEDG